MALGDPFGTTAELAYKGRSALGEGIQGITNMFMQIQQQKQQQEQKKALLNQQSMEKLKQDIYNGIAKGYIQPTTETTGEDVFSFPGMEKLGKFKIKKGTQASQMYSAEKFKAYNKMQQTGIEGLTDADKVILGLYPKQTDMKITAADIKAQQPTDIGGWIANLFGGGQAPTIKAMQKQAAQQKMGGVRETTEKPKYQIGQIIEKGGRRLRVTGFENGKTAVEEVR